jgi:hypothetical protein
MSNWRTAFASVIGTGHLKHQIPCQDFSLCSMTGDTLVCAVSDGAGTASYSDVGARIAVTHFVQSFGGIADLAAVDRDHMARFVGSLVELLVKEASENHTAICDYACTLLGVIASLTHTVYFQIGDGAIVIPASSPGAYDWVFWPQHGEYANTTNFVTQANAQDVFELRVEPAVSEFVIFSDGLERLILHEATRRVHAPALRPIFDWFRTAEAGSEGMQALTAYLESDHINRRTDDDKSLVVAVMAQD